ncbi:uncharacterized protein LOC131255511 [Magnolia sinica]|uniref:uncharacterized protein LOC131255511 n=1 Tax=Magnolia sinica TaxID=86752 RepID=UPI00265B0808|nr:uncharacterized protein LOC131255511 [Magnolia sinica]
MSLCRPNPLPLLSLHLYISPSSFSSRSLSLPALSHSLTAALGSLQPQQLDNPSDLEIGSAFRKIKMRLVFKSLSKFSHFSILMLLLLEGYLLNDRDKAMSMGLEFCCWRS